MLEIVAQAVINGLLIVPGATATCLSRNLRQLLWWSIGTALFYAALIVLLNLIADVVQAWLNPKQRIE